MQRQVSGICRGGGIAAAVLALLFAAGRQDAQERSGNDPVDDIRRDATVKAVEKVMPGVVNIATETMVRVRDPFDQSFFEFWNPYHQRSQSHYSLGSGVVVDEAGYLLTNDHVVRRADKIFVKLSDAANVYEAVVVATDARTDIALLKIVAPENQKFTAVAFAREEDLLLGETVLALGNPFGLGGSVSRGILSSKSRLAPKEGSPLEIPNWLQTDAAINFGNSGGPLVNLRGELIGINVGTLTQAQGIGFAVPIQRVLESLSANFPTDFVKSLWFGARVKVGTSPLEIMSVQPKSPADRAGLKAGDTVLKVNGTPPRSFVEFAELVAANTNGMATLDVQRASGTQRVSVKLVPEATVFNADLVRSKVGLTIEELTPAQSTRYGVNAKDAFLITGVQSNSPAATAGLQSGMLIQAWDGQTLPDAAATARLLYNKAPGDKVHLDISAFQRAGNMSVLRNGTVDLVVR